MIGGAVGYAARVASGGLIRVATAGAIAVGTVKGIAVAGGAAAGLLVGSAINCRCRSMARGIISRIVGLYRESFDGSVRKLSELEKCKSFAPLFWRLETAEC